MVLGKAIPLQDIAQRELKPVNFLVDLVLVLFSSLE
jgi:hypothetical protein